MRKANRVLGIRTRKAVLTPQTISIDIKQDTTTYKYDLSSVAANTGKGTYILTHTHSIREYQGKHY